MSAQEGRVRETIAAALERACSATAQALPAATRDINAWRPLEAALYCVRALARAIDRDIRQAVVVDRVMALAPQLPAHPQVQYTGLLVVGRYAEWLDAHPERLADVLHFISAALQQPSSLSAAAIALNNVCTACSTRLVDQLDALLALYTHVAGSGEMQLVDAREVVGAVSCNFLFFRWQEKIDHEFKLIN